TRFEGVVRPFVCEMPVSQTLQFGEHDRCDLLDGCFVSIAPSTQQHRKFGVLRLHHLSFVLRTKVSTLGFSPAIPACPVEEARMNLAGLFLILLVFGAKGEVPQLQKLLRWSDHPLLRQAAVKAAERIEKKANCAAIFGAGAVESLKAANYRFVPMG